MVRWVGRLEALNIKCYCDTSTLSSAAGRVGLFPKSAF